MVLVFHVKLNAPLLTGLAKRLVVQSLRQPSAEPDNSLPRLLKPIALFAEVLHEHRLD